MYILMKSGLFDFVNDQMEWPNEMTKWNDANVNPTGKNIEKNDEILIRIVKIYIHRSRHNHATYCCHRIRINSPSTYLTTK